jgi:hypothetical protein
MANSLNETRDTATNQSRVMYNLSSNESYSLFSRVKGGHNSAIKMLLLSTFFLLFFMFALNSEAKAECPIPGSYGPNDDPNVPFIGVNTMTVPHPFGGGMGSGRFDCPVTFEYCYKIGKDGSPLIYIGEIRVANTDSCGMEQIAEIQYSAYIPFFIEHVLDKKEQELKDLGMKEYSRCGDGTTNTVVFVGFLSCHTGLIYDPNMTSQNGPGGYAFKDCGSSKTTCPIELQVCWIEYKDENGELQRILKTEGMPNGFYEKPCNEYKHPDGSVSTCYSFCE